MTGKEMVKLLKEHGWEVDRISGSHHIMIKDPFRACARKERPEKRDTASPIEKGGTKMKIQYPLRVHKAEEGGFWAEFPDLPGCLTEGDTLKETLDNAQEALSGWLASRFERNFEIPAASSVKGKNVYLVEPLPEVGIPLILRKIRTESGLSQKEVAKKLEITYQTYQMWEKPASANPTIKQLAKVANAVGKKLVLEIA